MFKIFTRIFTRHITKAEAQAFARAVLPKAQRDEIRRNAATIVYGRH